MIPALAAYRPFFVVVALRDTDRVAEGQDIMRVFSFPIPVGRMIERLGIVAPGRGCIVLCAPEKKFDHMAFDRGAVGCCAMPQVIMRERHGTGFDHERNLASDVGVGRHAICRRVTKLRTGDDDGRPHIRCDVGRIVQTEKPVNVNISIVGAVLMPVHMPRTGLFAVPVAMRLHLVVFTKEAEERPLNRRMIERLPQFRHDVCDGVAGIRIQII